MVTEKTYLFSKGNMYPLPIRVSFFLCPRYLFLYPKRNLMYYIFQKYNIIIIFQYKSYNHMNKKNITPMLLGAQGGFESPF